MSHNLVTEIKQKLTCSKVGTEFAFTRERSSKLTLLVSTPPVMWEVSPYLCSYLRAIWLFTREALCRGICLQVQRASHVESVTHRAPRRPKELVRIFITVVSTNPGSFDCFLVRKSLLEFAIVGG